MTLPPGPHGHTFLSDAISHLTRFLGPNVLSLLPERLARDLQVAASNNSVSTRSSAPPRARPHGHCAPSVCPVLLPCYLQSTPIATRDYLACFVMWEHLPHSQHKPLDGKARFYLALRRASGIIGRQQKAVDSSPADIKFTAWSWAHSNCFTHKLRVRPEKH